MRLDPIRWAKKVSGDTLAFLLDKVSRDARHLENSDGKPITPEKSAWHLNGYDIVRVWGE